MSKPDNIKKFIECLMSDKNTMAKTYLKKAVDEKIKQKLINNNNKSIF